MTCITANLRLFEEKILSGQPIECNQKGEWMYEGTIKRMVRKLFGWQDVRLVKILTAFNAALDKLEQRPVIMNNAKESEHYNSYITAANAIVKSMKDCKSKAAKTKLQELKFKVVALKYRIEKENGGLDSVYSDASYGKLLALAKKWKENYPLYLKKEIAPEENARLKEVCAYPEFVKLLVESESKIQSDFFFKWALRDGCKVDAFVQYPCISNEIKNSYLAPRIGRFADSIKMIHYDDIEAGRVKDFKLPFEVSTDKGLEVQCHSILDKTKEVNLNKNYKRTIGQMMTSFASRNDEPGNVELLGKRTLEDGTFLQPRIANYNSLQCAPLDPQINGFVKLDFDKKEWWKQIAPLDTINMEDVKKIYGIDAVPEGQWVVVARATKESIGRDFNKSHGFIDVLIPNGKGEFELYSFGKYAAKWPRGLLAKILFIADTVLSLFEGPDENHYMAQRLQAIAPWLISSEKGLELMGLIRKKFVVASQGLAYIQFPWKNCAREVQRFLDGLLGPECFGGPVPDYFLIPLVETQPNVQPIKFIVEFTHKLKGKMQLIFLRLLNFLFLSWRGITIFKKGKKKFRSVNNSGHIKDRKIYLPSLLHEKIMKGHVKGIVTISNFFLKQN